MSLGIMLDLLLLLIYMISMFGFWRFWKVALRLDANTSQDGCISSLLGS